MIILPLIGYLGLILGFSFLVLSIASALYYLSELVEEHTVLSKTLLSHIIKAIIALHLLLLILDRAPIPLTLFSLASHLLYSLNLRSFPYVSVSDPTFLASCAAVLVNHVLWFRHFSAPPPFPRGHPMSPDYDITVARTKSEAEWEQIYIQSVPKFREVAGFFGVCVWLVPFALFVSLTAGENVLPSMSTPVSTPSGGGGEGFGEIHGGPGGLGGKKKRGEGMAKKVLGGVKEWVEGTLQAAGYGGRRTGRFD
ncbi:DUF396-domain-containing protein [Ascobolus immersus RN42]|uniref:DUF396-domain-containing protein n=1 Tax=Ascobolus immersus RN42 TaxID=1160509 RepID=A0A3N4IHV5_ASCIM|nr:DUF396-domain-containing protein [Ascobolus immersus RN42]